MKKKGQSNPAGMIIVSAFIILTVIGIVQLTSVLITSKVGESISDTLPLETQRTANETVNITMMEDPMSDNSTLLAEDGFITGTDSVANTTDSTKILVRNTDYKITLNGVSGVKDTTANLTIINVDYNISEVKVTYNTKEETSYHTTKERLVDDNLSSFELSGTAQVIFAAIVILISIFGLLAIMRSR